MFEQLIYDYLISDETITSNLTTYADCPAVFHLEAPSDTDEFWEGEMKYPRIVYDLNMQEDPERKTSGLLMIDLYFNTDSGLYAETVAPIIQNSINGRFFTENADTIAAIWRQTDPFTTPEEGSEISGITVTFDVVEFPSQLTFDIDPVLAINGFIHELYPDIKRIGIDTLLPAWQATDSAPAIYVRLQRLLPAGLPDTYNVTWITPVMMVHVIAPTLSVKNLILKNIIETLQQRQRIVLPDNSPLMINRMAVTTGADMLKAGQLSIEATYGILRADPPAGLLENIYVNEREVPD